MATNPVLAQYPNQYASYQYQASNATISIGTVRFVNISDFEYTDTCDVAEARGISPYSMGVTQGEYSASGNITVHLAYRDLFLDTISAGSPDGKSIFDSIFTFTVQWSIRTPTGIPQIAPFTDIIEGCKLTGGGVTLAAGNAVMVEKYPMRVGLIRRAGKYLPIAGLNV